MPRRVFVIRLIHRSFEDLAVISKWNNLMSYFISSNNMTSPPALSQGA